jgi:hypothetical protein
MSIHEEYATEWYITASVRMEVARRVSLQTGIRFEGKCKFLIVFRLLLRNDNIQHLRAY